MATLLLVIDVVGLPKEKRLVASLEEASKVWGEFMDTNDFGASACRRNCGDVLDAATGKRVARVSYNGKVWGPGEWKVGDKPLMEAK